MQTNERLNRLKSKANSLPKTPGVYIMKSISGEIIYIGKAVNLKARVTQYFGAGHQHNDKTKKMVSNVEDFEYILCDSEFEALILECSLIKQHSPKYNILLKDDKGYHYIKITKGEYPTVKAVMQLEDGADASFIGPYNSAFVVRQTVDEACKAFRLPQCSKTVFGQKKGRPCLNYHIGTCSAPCCGKISKEEYRQSVKSALDFIKNGAHSCLADLKQKMLDASDNLEFEKAARIRDRINAIEKLGERQKVVLSSVARQDVIAMAGSENTVCFEMFIFKNGRLFDRKEFLLDGVIDSENVREEFIKSYYFDGNSIPPKILIDEPIADRENIEKLLSEKIGKKVEISVPKIGTGLKLIKMCYANATERLAKQMGYKNNNIEALAELGKLLNLPKPPEYIEAYDISNTSGDENVGACVTFFNGEPLKKNYKLFKIKSFVGQDDCRSMAEVLERRITEYQNAKTDDGFGKKPDLVLLDGGNAQVNAVSEVFEKYGFDVPLFGMVKDSKHKTRAITAGGEDIEIKGNKRAFSLVFRIQEEVHRFVIGFHRKRRNKKTVASELLEIKGIGENTAKKLLKEFKSLKRIKSASLEQLQSVKGVTKTQSQNILNHFKG